MLRFVLAIAVIALILLSLRSGTPTGQPESVSEPTQGSITEPTTTLAPPMLGNALSLADLDGWLQSDVASLEELRGRVVIVQFWTFACSNCKATIPHLQDIYAEYGEAGLEIVGVHAPEFSFEEDPDAIATAARDLGVTWPIALDTDRRNFHRWQGSPAYWPRTYVLDQQGLIRFDHIGEGKYQELEDTVASLLAE